MAGTARVLVVDRDRELVHLLAFTLGRAGLQVSVAHESPAALDLLTAEQPDVIVLGLDPARARDVELLKTLRGQSQARLILLAASSTEEAVVGSLELGADDYLAKPFSFRELLARIHAQLRRAGRQRADAPMAPHPPLRAGVLVLDTANHAASHAGRPLPLTPTEFRLLAYLLERAGTVVPAGALLRAVWGRAGSQRADVVRVTVSRLRRKLRAVGAHDLLVTVPGVGFILHASGRE